MKVTPTVGRRPGTNKTRGSILASAKRQFSTLGYSHTTIRSIAKEAGVDTALVHHYFSNKHDLFLLAVLPSYQAPQMLVVALENTERKDFGVKIAYLVCSVMESSETTMTLTSMIRASASEPMVNPILQSFIQTTIIQPIAELLGDKDAELKATLIGAHVVGIFVARYITKLEPLASASPASIAVSLAPIFQAYIDA